MHMTPRTIAISLGLVVLAALLWGWLWWWQYASIGTITVKRDGVQLVSAPYPLYRSKPGANPVIATLKAGTVLDVKGRNYGKDYLMYRVTVDGKSGYVEFNTEELDIPQEMYE